MLRYLDTVARNGSIRRAAAELNVASSAINRQIIALEEELGVPLFERLPRRLLLTAAGEVVVEHVRETLKAYRRTEMKLDALKGLVRGRITIAVTPGLAEGPLPGVVSDFVKGHPGIHITLRGMPVDRIAPTVIGGDADLGLGYYLLPNAGLQALLRFETRFGAVLSAKHPLASRRKLRLADLQDYPAVLFEPGTRLRNIIDLAYERIALTAMPMVETNSIQALKRLVADGARVTLLNRLDVVDECARGMLVFRRLADSHLDRQPLVLAARARTTPSPMASLFAEALRKVLPDLVD
jgi:DNA-binding transcriptional LysR family regulator